MVAEDLRTPLDPHDHPEFEDMEKPWEHEHDGRIHMHGTQEETAQPPGLSALQEISRLCGQWDSIDVIDDVRIQEIGRIASKALKDFPSEA